MPVSVFGCFCISGFHVSRTAQKNPEKLYKKSANRKQHCVRKAAWGGHRGSRRPVGAPPGPRRGVPGPPEAPPVPYFGIYLKGSPKPLKHDFFSRSHLCSAAAAASKIGSTRRTLPGTLPVLGNVVFLKFSYDHARSIYQMHSNEGKSVSTYPR